MKPISAQIYSLRKESKADSSAVPRELDQYDTDMMRAMRERFVYLTTEKLGHGREQKP